MKAIASRPSRTGTALVVAAVRPARPNAAVIRAAAQLAATHSAELLIVGMVELYVVDWIDVPYTESVLIDTYQASLFSTCVELLYADTVRWSVHVTSESLTRTINELSGRRQLTGLVIGPGGAGGLLPRLRRRLLGPLRSRVGSLPTFVVEDDAD